jgi:DNA-binding Lrp family transcriptional regulator
MISDADRRLLHALTLDCRLTPPELSIQTGLSVTVIEEKIRHWEREGVLVAYKPIIRWEKLDENRVTAFIDIKVSTQRDRGYDAIAARFQKFPEIRSVYLMSGGSDLCLVVEGSNMYEVAQFVSDKLSPLEMVSDISTRFVLRRYKEDGIHYQDEEERPQRLMITP